MIFARKASVPPVLVPDWTHHEGYLKVQSVSEALETPSYHCGGPVEKRLSMGGHVPNVDMDDRSLRIRGSLVDRIIWCSTRHKRPWTNIKTMTEANFPFVVELFRQLVSLPQFCRAKREDIIHRLIGSFICHASSRADPTSYKRRLERQTGLSAHILQMGVLYDLFLSYFNCTDGGSMNLATMEAWLSKVCDIVEPFTSARDRKRIVNGYKNRWEDGIISLQPLSMEVADNIDCRSDLFILVYTLGGGGSIFLTDDGLIRTTVGQLQPGDRVGI